MIFTFFTIIVFVAELIICFSLIYNLIKLDNQLLSANQFIKLANPKLRSVLDVIKKFSEQLPEFAILLAENFKQAKERFVINRVKSLLMILLFWGINIKFINKIRKSKFIKLALKGFNLLQSMV